MKGQITIEFLVVVVALLLVLNFAFIVYRNNSILLSSNEELSEARVLAASVGNALNSTFLAGSGASGTFFFKKIRDINASLSGNVLQLSSSSGLADFTLITSSVNFEGFAFNESLNIYNDNGVVVVEKK
ncbi:MAG: hypothetical protein J4478_03260 [Candidatus Diapherotrites archaeon]|uniref:Class III signal peptide-containing protein n=3 Tax=Candidatus Iainarchaeum sp. TaxID=3101447 RepID=A0A8T4KW83_9ARCH|nr:hypothetical protein [Candidatus Diapherotrites archaeon]